MIQRLRNRREGGFTLIELLIVVAIIGIIAAILIPNLLDAIQKSKQKSTMSDIRTIGQSMFSWMSDVVSASAAGRGANSYDLPPETVTPAQLTTLLVSPDNPQSYLQELNEEDGWRCPFGFYINGGTDATANELQSAGSIMAIWSGGRPPSDGCEDPLAAGAAVERGRFISTDYGQDIVWGDGFFIRRPGGLNEGS